MKLSRIHQRVNSLRKQRGFLLVGRGGAPVGGYQVQRSVRLRSAASASLSRTPSTAGNRKQLSGRYRIKRGALGSVQVIASAGTSSIDRLYFNASDQLCLDVLGTLRLATTPIYRDPTSWYVDVEFQLDVANGTAANRAKILINGVEVSAYSTDTRSSITNTDTNWNNTVVHYLGRDNAGNYFDGYLAEPIGVDGGVASAYSTLDAATNQRVPVRPSATYGTNGFYLDFSDITSSANLGYDKSPGSFSVNLRQLGTNIGGMTSQGGLVSAFSGIVPNQANGATTPTQAAGYSDVNTVGKDWGAGVTRTITAFRIWSPTDEGFRGDQVAVGFKLQGSADGSSWVDLYTGTTPAGIYQQVQVTSGITTSTAYRYHRIVINGNGSSNCRLGQVEFFEAGQYGINNWFAYNFSLTSGVTYDSMLDVPGLPWADGGNGRGNYCTLNPLGYKPANTTISQANLRVMTNSSSCFGASGSIAVSSGKWYWEATFAGAQHMIVGIDSATTPISTDTSVGSTSSSYGYYSGNGNKINNNSGSAYGASYTTNDVIGVALDMDAGTLVFYKNGTSQGTAFSGLAGSFVPSFSDVDVPSGGCDIAVNFGQRPFAYTPPTGFKALHTGNLTSDTVITSGSFTGNASADGPFVWCNGTPETLTINGNAVTWGTHADRLANGFKLRTSSSSYNASGTNTWTATVLTPMAWSSFRNQNAKGNP